MSWDLVRIRPCAADGSCAVRSDIWSASVTILSTISAAGGMSWIRPTASPAMTAAISKLPAALAAAYSAATALDILQQLDFASHPAPRMIVDQAAAGKRRRPDIVARQIEDNTPDRVAAGCRADPLFRFFRAVAFLAGIKARAEQHAAKRPASSSRPSRAHRRCRLRPQPARGRPRDRRSLARCRSVVRDAPWPPASVPCAIRISAPASSACRAISSFCTWQISSAPADLMRGANGLGSPNESMTARGCAVERDVQQFRPLRKAPGDEADAEGSRYAFELGGLLLEPGSVAITAAENAETARGADRRR